MEVVSPSSSSPKFVGKDRNSELYGNLNYNFGAKFELGFTEEKERCNSMEKSWLDHDKTESKTDEDNVDDDAEYNDGDADDDDDDGGDKFSFASVNGENSPITAEEAFEDGRIRAVYLNRNLLFSYERDFKEEAKPKLFVEGEEAVVPNSEESTPLGPYCLWPGRIVENTPCEICRKSNSTEPLGPFCLWPGRTSEETSHETCQKSNSTAPLGLYCSSSGRTLEETTHETYRKSNSTMGPYCSWPGRTVEETSQDTCQKSNSTATLGSYCTRSGRTVEETTNDSCRKSNSTATLGPICSWSGRTVEGTSSHDTCRKSNSTGFSKLWRFKDLVPRSNSDGKDAFVFLNNENGDDKNRLNSFLTNG